MGILVVNPQIVENICMSLKLKSLSRPYAVLLDEGDLGTVFTYLPLMDGEYEKLPLELRKYAYLLRKGKYCLIGYQPKIFEGARDGKVTSVSVTYNELSNIVALSYTLDTGETSFFVEHPLRRDKLLALAKKKKLPVKSMVKSSK
ncbi:hypothetical protein AUK22_03615 [bacterium CG2_30_54_10]|nr:MAG: hypothetical protein AUK22_03615 [bacterium CG2_30_54_10]